MRYPAQRHASGYAALAIVVAGTLVAQAFGRFTYGVLLPAVRDDFGISNTLAGTIGSVNVGAYLVGTVAVAALTAKLRLLVVLRLGFVFTTSGLALAALAPTPLVLGLGMFLTGIGGAMIWIPSPVIAADCLPMERRGLAVGLLGSGIGLGIVFSGLLSSFVRGRSGDSGWRTVYAIDAGIAVVVLAAILLFVQHQQDRPTGGPVGIGGFDTLRRMPGWRALTAAYASFGMMYLLVIAFLTTRLEDDSGWSEADASLVFTCLGLAVVVGGPVALEIARRVGPRPVLATSFTVWAVLTLAVLPGWFGATFAAAIGLGLMFAAIPGLITLYVVENTSTADYGPSFAAATLAFGFAQGLAPQIGGLVSDLSGSFTLVFALSTLLAIVGAFSALRLPRR